MATLTSQVIFIGLGLDHFEVVSNSQGYFAIALSLI